MSDDMLIRHCAPTLAGLKTGNLFSCFFDDKAALIQDIRKINKTLRPKGICLLPLLFSDGRALLYLYRPDSLRKDLADEEVFQILKRFGYKGNTLGQCLRNLIDRLKNNADFPHEIGLFLSYPPEDVKGFIDDKDHFKFSGLWKVYGDEKKARTLFDQYKKCTEYYCGAYRSGVSLERLAVAI